MFDEHVSSALYTLKYHSLDDVVEDIQRFEPSLSWTAVRMISSKSIAGRYLKKLSREDSHE